MGEHMVTGSALKQNFEISTVDGPSLKRVDLRNNPFDWGLMDTVESFISGEASFTPWEEKQRYPQTVDVMPC